MTLPPTPTAYLVILATHNLVQNTVLNERGYVSGNLAVSALLLAVARKRGLGWDEMGLDAAPSIRGLRLGTRPSVVGALAVGAALTHPSSRPFLASGPATDARGAAVWRRAPVRFPLGTALFEEVAFRGVLPAIWGRRHRPFAADLFSAGVFALWHLIPTARTLKATPTGELMSARDRFLTVIGGAAAAGFAGLGFSFLRRRGGNILAPWMAHATLNSLAYLAGAAANRGRR